PVDVLETLEADHVSSLKKMGKTILTVIENAEVKGISPPANIIAESKLSERAATSVNEVGRLGENTIFACPDCGGGLWKIENGRTKHYRCHIGHSFSENDLLIRQSEEVEHTLWVAVRMMEERKLLLEKIARENSERGLQKLGSQYESRANDLEEHIGKLKELLFAVNRD